MKTINNSSRNKALCALILIPAICVLQLIFHIDKWTWLITMTLSILLYLSLMTYFCIKQKCIKQLMLNYLIGIVFLSTLYLQFVYVPEKTQNIDRNQREMNT